MIEAKIKLKPFLVPNFVLADQPPKPRQEGFIEGQQFALSELDVATLDLLCEQFREDVFKKAGKDDPQAA